METLEPFPIQSLFGIIVIKSIDIYIILSIILSIILMYFSALLTGAENSYFTFGSNEINQFKKNSDYRSNLIVRYLEKQQEFLSTLVISNIAVNITLIVTLSYIFNSLIELSFSATINFLIQAAVIALLLILFGETIPKYSSGKDPLKYARKASIPILPFYKIFYPFGKVLASTSTFISKRLSKIKQDITIDDLSSALNITSEQITEDDNILKGIVKFGNIDVKEIMRSRVDVVAVENTIKYNELLQTIKDSGHSRIPVFEETFDNIKGVLYIKDLLPHLKEKISFNWQALIRPPFFVPENKKINDLLKDFQSNKTHMAIVIDEYGGANGIITMEDILEEIVGEITDESDSLEIFYKQLSENVFVFEGKTQINDIYKIIDIEDDFFEEVRGDADTIAGLLLELTGEIPSPKQVIEYKNITFTVESVDKRRIKSIEIKIN